MEQLLAEHGSTAALRDMGYRALTGAGVANVDDATALRHLAAAATAGDAVAAFNLGYMHLNGLGETCEPQRGTGHGRRGVKKSRRQPHLTERKLCVWLGAGTEANTTAAAELFEQAMRGDVGPAYNALGTMHFHGQGRARNLTTALAFFTEAAARNSPDGHFNAANMHYHGLATPRHLSKVPLTFTPGFPCVSTRGACLVDVAAHSPLCGGWSSLLL
jgi:TPR repeat protein